MNNKLTILWMVCLLAGSSVSEAEALKLSEAYELALKNEPKLRASAFRAQAMDEYVEQSKAKLYPQLQGNLSYGRYEYDAAYLQKPVKENYNSYSLSATQGLFHPEVWSGIDQAKAKQKTATYEYYAESQKMGLDLTKAYFNFLRTKKNLDLLVLQKEYYDAKYRQLEKMLTLGLTNRIDLLESKVQRDKAINEWISEHKRHHAARLKLEHMIGAPVESIPEYDFHSIDPQKFSIQREDWERKLSLNPTLLATTSSQEIAQHEVSIRKFLHYPTVDISLSRKETNTEDSVAHTYDNQAIIQMSIPLYQGGYTQSRVREGLLLLNAANEELNYARKEVSLKFEELWAEREYTIESLRTLTESEKSAELFVESVEKGYAAGLKSIVDVLEAKSKYFEVKRDLIDAGYEMVNNELGLLDIIGELNPETITSLEKKLINSSN